MQPVGAVVGTASALLGAVSIAVGSAIGARVDRAFDGTIKPLATAFVVSGVVAFVCVTAARWTSRASVLQGFAPQIIPAKVAAAPVLAAQGNALVVHLLKVSDGLWLTH